MGIYIKGMEMPKTAFDCSVKVNPEERQCVFTHKTFEETLGLLTERRCADCPLVEIKEPHGRLIDGDALADDLEADGKEFGDEMKLNCASWLRSNATPTIIESEVEE